MDLGRVLGALLGGAAQPPRRRRRTTPSLLNSRSGNAQLGRAIGAIAGVAIEAMMRGSQGQGAPQPAPTPAPRRDSTPWNAPPPAPARRMPQSGASPWSVPTPAPEPEATTPAAEDAEGLLLIRAMVAAARADGALDAAERRAIAAQLDAAGLDAAERDYVLADFDRPMTVEALAREASDPMLKARLYAAAVAGAGTISPGERAWLDSLAKALRLDKAAAAAIEERLGE
jgi:uncharacterized membrane protein YebE (DUF533 family)